MALIASVFVIITNLRDTSKSVIRLDFRIISTQLIILLAWILILSKALQAETIEQTFVSLAVFVFSIVIGVLFIQSVIKENKASKISSKLIKSFTTYTKRLQELDKEKTEFVSLASHQLRTPTSKITGYSSMLLGEDFGKLNKKQKEAIKIISDSAQNLNSIINELLDTTRIEQKTIKYEEKEFDLIDILENADENYRRIAESKGLKFETNFDKEYGITIKGDKEKIRQAIFNIIDNAIKYTEKGFVKISAKKDGDRAKISIEDSGIGIDSSEIHGLFNKFVRASNAKDLNVTGSGLGLFVSREIIVANGGEIKIESEGKGKGSNFVIEFSILS